jgi:putative oxidoreductase
LNKFLFGPFVEGRAALGLTIFRFVTGVALMMHGLPKIQHPFSWMGPTSEVHSILQFLAAISEFGGGLALVLGLLTPVACLGIFFTMSYAVLMVHMPHGDPWIGKGKSFEPAMSYLIAAVTLFLTGPGKYSLDAKLFGNKRIETKVVKEPVAV